MESVKALIRRGLALDLPYYPFKLPEQGREAAVIVLIAFGRGSSHQEIREASVLLTRRTDRVETHKGQVALPGGHRDPSDASEEFAALRELEEEVGIPPAKVQLVGRLPVLWTRTGFLVTPVVGFLESPLEDVEFRVSAEEIDEVFWAPVSHLLEPETYSSEEVELVGRQFLLHSFQVGPNRVWGVTGSIIKNFLDRILAVT